MRMNYGIFCACGHPSLRARVDNFACYVNENLEGEEGGTDAAGRRSVTLG